MTRAAVAAFLLMASSASAQCLGDFDGDNMVEITELITSVNNALNNCQGPVGTPTPIGEACPIDFADDNIDVGSPEIDCFYVGRWNQSCGAADLEVRFISDLANNADEDDLVILDFTQFTDPPLFYGARTTSATTAELIGWFTTTDVSDLTEAPGTLSLNDSGRALLVVPDGVPFSIEACDFVRYQGALTEVVDPTAQRAAALKQVAPAAFERLRAMRANRVPRPNFQRQ